METEDCNAAKKPRLDIPENDSVQGELSASSQTGSDQCQEGSTSQVSATNDVTCGTEKPCVSKPENGTVQPTDQTETVDTKIEKPVGERDVGITEYISDHEGFQGIIKHRFSDFLVNEIDLAGNRICLTDISQPEPDDKKEESAAPEGILSESNIESLTKLAEGGGEDETVILPAGEDKQQRSQIHGAIRQSFPQLESTTTDRDGDKVIVVCKSSGSQGQRQRGGKSFPARRQEAWQHQGTDYCHFCLYKENMDTMEAVNILSKFLHIKPSMVTYAGTKDKRAKTCQKMCVNRITAGRLHSLNKKLRSMTLGNFCYNKNALKLGDLKGNHFTIVLRNVTGSLNQITQATASLDSLGFINYFGMQRFGTSSVPTHLVGRALLMSNWQEAIELILKPREGTKAEITAARLSWWKDRNHGKALALLGSQYCPERQLLTGLKQRPQTDLVGALGFISRNQRTMYVHAYQSYIWNKMVSRRHTEYGLKPVIGDLVIKADNLLEADPKSESGQKKEFVHPTVLSEANIQEYTINDVVMPLPGYDVHYPDNIIGQLYREALEADGLSVQDLKHKVKDYALRGQYRYIVVKPVNMSGSVTHYEDSNDPLILSDLDKLNDVKAPEYIQDGKYRALKLEFSLPSSTYATMALREFLKQDTSAASQSKLTAACT